VNYGTQPPRTIPLYRHLRESSPSFLVTVSTSSKALRVPVFRWDGLVHASHRYLLPVLSGLCFFLGGVLLLRGPGALGRWVPLALAILGSGTLATSLVYLRWRYPREMNARPTPVAVEGFPPSIVDPPSSVPAPPSLEWEDLFYGRYEFPSRGEGASATLRVLFTPTSAADQLWVHWLPTDVGNLPSELIPPIADSAYFPSEAEVRLSPDEVELPPTSTLPEFEVGVVLDPPWPLEEGGSFNGDVAHAFDTESLPSGESINAGAEQPTAPTCEPAPPPKLVSETPHWMRTILAEATNPLPPHLRTDSVSKSRKTPTTLSGPGPLAPVGPTGP
jgi:hypothetical protein